jgi:hypothetical protein
MSTKNLIGYATSGQVTCSNASLASGSSRESAVVNNTGNQYLDTLVSLTFTIASGTPSSNGGYVNIYANGSNDGTLWPIIQTSTGTTYQTGQGDASVGALGIPTALRLIGSFGLTTNSSASERTFRTEAYSVAAGFGGNLPPEFSIVIENQTGVAFSTSTVTTANYLQQTGVFTTSGN